MISSINDHAGAAPPLKLRTSFPTEVTVNWKNSKFAKPGLMVATISPFHSTFTNAAASCAGGLNELDWKNPIEYCRPGIVARGLAGVSRTGEGVIGFRRPKERDCVPVVRERCEEENSSVISAAWGACTDPSAVGIGKAEVVALLEILKPTVDDCVDALVATRLGDKEASLTIIVCGRSVGWNKVLHTDVSPEGKTKSFIITMLQVYVVGTPFTRARQMLKNWHSPP